MDQEKAKLAIKYMKNIEFAQKQIEAVDSVFKDLEKRPDLRQELKLDITFLGPMMVPIGKFGTHPTQKVLDFLKEEVLLYWETHIKESHLKLEEL